MILVDTSAWIAFFRGQKEVLFLQEFIQEDKVVIHPAIKGELVLGGLSGRTEDLIL